jgi:hypothetical protein
MSPASRVLSAGDSSGSNPRLWWDAGCAELTQNIPKASRAGRSYRANSLKIRPSHNHSGQTTSTVRLRMTSSLPGPGEAAEELRRPGEGVRGDGEFPTLCREVAMNETQCVCPSEESQHAVSETRCTAVNDTFESREDPWSVVSLGCSDPRSVWQRQPIPIRLSRLVQCSRSRRFGHPCRDPYSSSRSDRCQRQGTRRAATPTRAWLRRPPAMCLFSTPATTMPQKDNRQERLTVRCVRY